MVSLFSLKGSPELVVALNYFVYKCEKIMALFFLFLKIEKSE